MVNFLKETQKALELADKTPNDIFFIGSADGKYECSWAGFVELANFNYQNGFGKVEIPVDLVIIFNDNSRLMRETYDGSESWLYTPVFKLAKQRKLIRRLKINEHEYVCTVDEIVENARLSQSPHNTPEPTYEAPQPIWEQS